MLTSLIILQNALEKYSKQKRKRNKENYNALQSLGGGFSIGVATGFLVISIVFFALEIIVLIFAVNVAIKCSLKGPERIVHVVLAIVFTLPYMLLNLLFNKCATDTLRGNYNGKKVISLNNVKMNFSTNKL
jgi:uncharacterized membrane protein YbhN (UPF0104 family)